MIKTWNIAFLSYVLCHQHVLAAVKTFECHETGCKRSNQKHWKFIEKYVNNERLSQSLLTPPAATSSRCWWQLVVLFECVSFRVRIGSECDLTVRFGSTSERSCEFSSRILFISNFTSRFCRIDSIGWAQNTSKPIPNWWVQLIDSFYVFPNAFKWPRQSWEKARSIPISTREWAVFCVMRHTRSGCETNSVTHSWRSVLLLRFSFLSQLCFGKMKTPIFLFVQTFCRLINSHFGGLRIHRWMHWPVSFIDTVSALLWLLLCMSTAAAIFTCRFQRTVLAATAAATLLRSHAHKECTYTSGRRNSN